MDPMRQRVRIAAIAAGLVALTACGHTAPGVTPPAQGAVGPGGTPSTGSSALAQLAQVSALAQVSPLSQVAALSQAAPLAVSSGQLSLGSDVTAYRVADLVPGTTPNTAVLTPVLLPTPTPAPIVNPVVLVPGSVVNPGLVALQPAPVVNPQQGVVSQPAPVPTPATATTVRLLPPTSLANTIAIAPVSVLRPGVAQPVGIVLTGTTIAAAADARIYDGPLAISARGHLLESGTGRVVVQGLPWADHFTFDQTVASSSLRPPGHYLVVGDQRGDLTGPDQFTAATCSVSFTSDAGATSQATVSFSLLAHAAGVRHREETWSGLVTGGQSVAGGNRADLAADGTGQESTWGRVLLAGGRYLEASASIHLAGLDPITSSPTAPVPDGLSLGLFEADGRPVVQLVVDAIAPGPATGHLTTRGRVLDGAGRPLGTFEGDHGGTPAAWTVTVTLNDGSRLPLDLSGVLATY